MIAPLSILLIITQPDESQDRVAVVTENNKQEHSRQCERKSTKTENF